MRVVRDRGVARPSQLTLGGQHHLLLTEQPVGPELLAEQTQRAVSNLRVGERGELLTEVLEAGVGGDAPVATVEISHGGGGNTGRAALGMTVAVSLSPLPVNDAVTVVTPE